MAAYGTDQGLLDWLAANGLTLPAGAPTPAVLRAQGSAYVDGAYEPRLYCSERMDPLTQELAWPRRNATVSGQAIPEDLIPQAWINAAYRAAYLQAINGFATGGTNPSRMTKREKAGEVEREFFAAGEGGIEGNAAPGFNVDPLIDGQLSIWLCATNDGGVLPFLWSVGS